MDEQRMLTALTHFARTLVGEYEISEVLHDLVEAMTEALDVTGAGVSLAHGPELRFATAMSESIAAIEKAQETAQRGPCIDAYRQDAPVLVDDLTDLADLWPEVAHAAAESGIGAVASVPMHVDGQALGAVDLYASGPRAWSDRDVHAARLLADMATAYIVNTNRFVGVQRTAEQLQRALDTRVIIEQAKGIVACEHDTSVDEAFEILRRHARSNNLELRSVAQAVVNDGLRLTPPPPSSKAC